MLLHTIFQQPVSDTSKPKSVTASPASHIESIQQQMHEFVTLNKREREEVAEASARLSETHAMDDLPGFEPFDSGAYGIKPEGFRSLGMPAKQAAATPEADPVAETRIAPEPEPIASKPVFRESVIQHWLNIIETDPLFCSSERLKQWSLEPLERGEAAKIAIAKREAEPVIETSEPPQPESGIESKPLKEVLVQYWIDIINDRPSHYPEETMRQLSLQTDEKGEAVRRIIAQRAAIDEPFEAPEPEFKKK